jgi:septum formation protein
VPPRDASEAGFEGLHERPAIEARLLEIAREKSRDVTGQLLEQSNNSGVSLQDLVIAADTTVIVTRSDKTLEVVGQPPADDSWKETVRHWFRAYYAGRSHVVQTALCVSEPGGRFAERVVTTEVTFIADVERHLEWYIATGEPRGKAGGYGIQGAGSIFVSRVAGSLSNVIGLPLEALLEVFSELEVKTADPRQALSDGT